MSEDVESTPLFSYKFFKHLKKYITLLTYLLPCSAGGVSVTSSQHCGPVKHLARP